MFTPGGQCDLFTFAAVRGGGKGGGGSDNSRFESRPVVLTDPVDGTSFVQETNPFLAYMQGGGGGKSAQDQLNEHITARKAQEQALSDKAKQDAADKATAAENTFQTSRNTSYNDALQSVLRQFQLQGVDPNQYMDTDIRPALGRAYNSIQDLDPNPSAAFSPTLGNTIISDITGGKRTQAASSLNSLFSPTYSSDVLPDTLGDADINTILGEQFDPLSAQLTNAQKRGTLTGAGYNAALDALNQKRTAARSTLSTLGQNILTGDRAGIDTLIGGARTAAGNLGLNDAWDPSVYGKQAQSKVASDIAGFGGALRSAVGDTKFADLTDLLNAGGNVQGATNPTAANPIGGGGTVPDDALATQKRGLGNTGAF